MPAPLRRPVATVVIPVRYRLRVKQRLAVVSYAEE
jgi:hypothetical protein